MVLLLSACSRAPMAETAAPNVIRQQIRESTAPLLLVHVWATWCQPCREEFPELLEVCRQYRSKGLETILISADDPDELGTVESFLIEHQSTMDSLVATDLGQEFIESLSPDWAGSLPASFFYADGILLAEWEGKHSFEQYAETIESLLNK